MVPFQPTSIQQPTGNSAMIAAIFQPTVSWAARMQVKDRDLQYQMMLTRQEQQKELELQAADAEIQQYKAGLNEAEFEEPDQKRVGGLLREQEKALATRLKDEYQGDVAKFFKTEGSAWMTNAYQALKKSTVYKTAERNREQIGLLKRAIANGETPVGRVIKDKDGKDRYVSADEMAMLFYSHNAPDFTFQGSYKDDEDDLKELRDSYAPGAYSWQKIQVPEEQIFNHLLAKNPANVATDKFYRKYRQSKVFYKSDPVEKAAEFQMKVQSFKADQALKNQRFQEGKLDMAKKQRDATAEQRGVASPGYNFLLSQLQNSQPGGAIDVNSADERALPSGIDLNRFSGNRGVVRLNKIPLAGDARRIIDQQFNFQESKEKDNDGTYRANIREGFTEQKGLPLNLEGINYRVLDRDNAIFYPASSLNSNGMPVDRTGPVGFARVKIKLDSDSEAEKLGLYNAPWLWTNSNTKKGSTSHYNSDDRSLWIYTPLGSVTERNFQHAWQTEQLGQTAANMGLGMGRKRTK